MDASEQLRRRREARRQKILTGEGQRLAKIMGEAGSAESTPIELPSEPVVLPTYEETIEHEQQEKAAKQSDLSFQASKHTNEIRMTSSSEPTPHKTPPSLGQTLGLTKKADIDTPTLHMLSGLQLAMVILAAALVLWLHLTFNEIAPQHDNAWGLFIYEGIHPNSCPTGVGFSSYVCVHIYVLHYCSKRI